MQGKTEEAADFSDQAAQVKEAYNNRFFHEETAQYSNNTVTANLLSLRFGLVPEGFEERVFANIVDKTMNDFNGHVSTGLVGIQWLMRGLTCHGRGDIAYAIATIAVSELGLHDRRVPPSGNFGTAYRRPTMNSQP